MAGRTETHLTEYQLGSLAVIHEPCTLLKFSFADERLSVPIPSPAFYSWDSPRTIENTTGVMSKDKIMESVTPPITAIANG